MIQLFPAATDRDAAIQMSQAHGSDTTSAIDVRRAVAGEERTGNQNRPWIYTNMITSADGGTAVAGLSGGLGGPGDKTMFGSLRSVADIIIVGASTVREERYRPPNHKPEVSAERVARGQRPHARLAIVSRSLDLDPDLPLFEDLTNRPYIVTTTTAPPEALARLEGLADVLVAGATAVDLGQAVELLAGEGAETILSEGGPSLNGQLIAAGLIDEWNLSISPHLLGADSKRAAVGPLGSGPPQGMTLARVWSQDDYLFCRWVRNRQV